MGLCERVRPSCRFFLRITRVKERLSGARGRTMTITSLMDMRLASPENHLGGRRVAGSCQRTTCGCHYVPRLVERHIAFDQRLTAQRTSFPFTVIRKMFPESASREADLRSTTKYWIAEAASRTCV